MDTVIKLGDFAFGHLEVPDKINFGGEQKLAVHELVGGERLVDALGRQDADVAWSGLFLGSAALQRARYVDSLRIAGNALSFTYSQFSYQVMIKSFSAEFERYYQIPYHITLQVISDLTQPVTTITPLSFDDAIVSDMNLALDLANLINNPSLSSAIGLLNQAVLAVPSFDTATQAQINSVLIPLAAAQANVGLLINTITGGLF